MLQEGSGLITMKCALHLVQDIISLSLVFAKEARVADSRLFQSTVTLLRRYQARRTDCPNRPLDARCSTETKTE